MFCRIDVSPVVSIEQHRLIERTILASLTVWSLTFLCMEQFEWCTMAYWNVVHFVSLHDGLSGEQVISSKVFLFLRFTFRQLALCTIFFNDL